MSGASGQPLPDRIVLHEARVLRAVIFAACIAGLAFAVWGFPSGDLAGKPGDDRFGIALTSSVLGLAMAPGVFGFGNHIRLDQEALAVVHVVFASKWSWLECSPFLPVHSPGGSFLVGFSTTPGPGQAPQGAALRNVCSRACRPAQWLS